MSKSGLIFAVVEGLRKEIVAYFKTKNWEGRKGVRKARGQK